jgi:hypothetical protein
MRFVKSETAVTTKNSKLAAVLRAMATLPDGVTLDGEEVGVSVEVPEVDGGVAELVKFHGGEQGLVDFCNAQYATNAKNGARAPLRVLTETSNLAEAIPTIQAIAKEYVPQAGSNRGPSKAKKLIAFDNIKSRVESGQEFTREQLLELLAEAK